MKIVTWNVRGICSSSKRYSMWKTIFISQWDVLCHKVHAKSGSSLQYKQYHVFYAGVIGGLYSGAMLIVRDNLKPIVVQRDVHGRFLVVEVNYEGNKIWVVAFMHQMLQDNISIYGELYIKFYAMEEQVFC